MNVLLLNPPGKHPYQRDYYCSKVAKAAYLFHPTDLLILSGILARRHEVSVLDALAEGLVVEEALRRIELTDPDAVISLCGAVSWEEDRGFFRQLKKRRPGTRLVVSGDLVLEGPGAHFDGEPAIDALLLDFTTEDILAFLAGGEGETIPNLFYRHAGGWVGKLPERTGGGPFAVPVPRFELFPQACYRFPLLKGRPFATVLTDYGCRYHCRFCVTGNLGYKWRPADNVLAELDHLQAQGYREVYFNDQTFGLERERTEMLLAEMVTRRYGFGWACWCRADLVDRELLARMRQAGCHTIMFGAEAADDEVLARWGKGLAVHQVEAALRLCRQVGIRTLATFLLGLPGQGRKECLATIEFARRCGCDFASFNVPVPRMTTALRREALQAGWIEERDVVFDQSGFVAAMGNGILSAREIFELKRRAVRSFYLRPSYLAGKLLAVRSLAELADLLRFGLATLR